MDLRKLRNITSVLAIGLLTLSGCTTGGALSTSGTIVTGAWGGVHAGLALTADSGTISYDCAHGALAGPVRLDNAGGFSVVGVHVREHGGPVRIGEVPDSIPARYVGQVDGDRMVLRVFAGPDTLGPFTLQRGTPPLLVRCL